MIRYIAKSGGTFDGAEFPDGNVVGYDYGAQQWIDTRPDVERDPQQRPGSARNPLCELPVIADVLSHD